MKRRRGETDGCLIMVIGFMMLLLLSDLFSDYKKRDNSIDQRLRKVEQKLAIPTPSPTPED